MVEDARSHDIWVSLPLLRARTEEMSWNPPAMRRELVACGSLHLSRRSGECGGPDTLGHDYCDSESDEIVAHAAAAGFSANETLEGENHGIGHDILEWVWMNACT
jgi:hypothetical protein